MVEVKTPQKQTITMSKRSVDEMTKLDVKEKDDGKNDGEKVNDKVDGDDATKVDQVDENAKKWNQRWVG